jgi:hypothetical protein
MSRLRCESELAERDSETKRAVASRSAVARRRGRRCGRTTRRGRKLVEDRVTGERDLLEEFTLRIEDTREGDRGHS